MRYKLLILVSLTAVLFTSCNGKPGVIVPDFEKYDGLNPNAVELSGFNGISSESLSILKQSAAEFNKTNKYGIRVSFDSEDSVSAETSDFAIVNPSDAALLLRNKKSIELSPLISHPVWGLSGDRRRFFKAAGRQTDYWYFSRKITSIPLLMNAGVMIVNNTILNDAGFESFPENWSGMKRLLHTSGDELKRPLGIELDNESIVDVIQARGGSIHRSLGNSYSLNNPVVYRTLRAIRKYQKNNLLSVNSTNYVNQIDFTFGRLLAVFTGIDGIKAYDELITIADPELDWGTELLPTVKPGDRVSVNCIYSGAVMDGELEKQLASWIFIKWLTDVEQQKTLSAETLLLPSVTAALDDIISTGGNGVPEQWIQAAGKIKNSKLEAGPDLYDYTSVSGQFELMVDRIIKGNRVWLETMKLEKKIKRDRQLNSEKRQALNEKSS